MVTSLRRISAPSAALTFCLLLGSVFNSPALVYQTVYKFPTPPRGGITGLTKANDGSFLGVSEYGGTNDAGAIYRITTNGVLQTIASLDPLRTGRIFTPRDLLLTANGNFYGTTSDGPNGGGAIFRVNTNGVLKVLTSFPGTTVDKRRPQGLVRGTDGNFYGIIYNGVSTPSFFRATTNGAVTVLRTLTNAVAEAYLVLGQDGNFYGTSDSYGNWSSGYVFKITKTGDVTKLHDFNGPDGSNPTGRLVERTNGVFYGVTTYGGTYFYGSVFKVTSDGVFTNVHSFDSTDGLHPLALVNAGSVIYGVAERAVFQIDSDDVVSTIATFPETTRLRGITVGDDGNLYCTSLAGGDNSVGAVYKVTPTGDVTTLYAFPASVGASPTAPLQLLDDGSLLGTTFTGGTNELGALFRMTPDGEVSSLNAFTDSEGFSQKILTKTADGRLYLTADGGGDDAEGGIYSVSPDGQLSLLNSFSGDTGSAPMGPMVEGSAGKLYGVELNAPVGGNNGGIFSMTTNGSVAVIANFAGANGSRPVGPLCLGPDDNFYGVTTRGGLTNNGTVFRVGQDGTLTTLLLFKKSNGANPIGGLISGQDGSFYGTTSAGGKYNAGTVFRLGTNGALTTLFHFAKTNGMSPMQLVQGTNGILYGTTVYGGKYKLGTVFRITTNGVLTTLCHLSRTNGAYPQGPLTLMPDGTLYGLAGGGGDGAGVIFHLVKVPPTITVQPLSRTNALRSTASFSVAVTGPSPFTYQWLKDGVAIIKGTRSILSVTNVQYASAGNYSVLVSNVDGFVSSSDALLTVAPPPMILSQPESQTATVGTTVDFSVTATSMLPLTYQWQFKGAALAGKTRSTLTLSNAQPANAGNYRVIVKNGSGSVTSSNAVLTMQTCSYTLSTNVVYMTSAGGDGVVSVTANFGDCSWLTANTNSWITLTSGVTNTGNADITFTVATNTSSTARIGSIIMSGTNFVVLQAGTFEPTTVMGKVFTFRVTSSPGSNFQLTTSLNSDTFTRLPASNTPTNYTYQRTGASAGSLSLPQVGVYQLSFDSPTTGSYLFIATNNNLGTGSFVMTDAKPDYNGDGSADVLWENTTGALRVSFMNRTNYLGTVTLANVIDNTWAVAGQADFDGNGSFDQVMHSSSGLVRIFYMTGTNFTSYSSLNSGNPVDTAWKIVGVHDMDHDGQADLIWQHTSGSLWIWLMNGTSIKSSYVVRNGTSPGPAWHVMAVADFNNDGEADLLMRHDLGYVQVWYMSGTTFVSSSMLFNGLASAASWQIMGVNDFDADGQMDLLVENANGDLFVWVMHGIVRDHAFALPGPPSDASWRPVSPK